YRNRLVNEPPASDDMISTILEQALAKIFRLSEPLDYEPEPDRSLLAVGQQRGCHPLEIAIQWMLEDNGTGMLLYPFENYAAGNLDV
ncbi:MAG TPA: amidohydrolase, partial [Gammaproteobacteria bacterium]|nr:amidohydrolase [Gammaproteobacteria bacterium]